MSLRHNETIEVTDWPSIAAVTLGITAFATAQGLTYPLLSFLLDNRGVSESVVGLHAAAFMFGLAFSVVVLPMLNRSIRAGFLIIGGLAGAAIVLVGFATIDNLFIWFFLRFFLGFCTNTIYVLGEAWLNAATAEHMRGRIAGIYGAGMAFGFVLGPMGIPVFGTEGGLAFAVCASISALVAFIFAMLSQHAKVEPERIVFSEIFSFFRIAPLMVMLVVIFGIMDSTAIAIMPLYLTNEGLSQSLAAVFVTVLHIGMIITQPILGILLDHFDRWKIAIGCLIATGFSFFALMHVSATSILIWPVAAISGAAFFGVYTSALALLGQDHKGSVLVGGSAAFALAYSIGGVGGPVTAGYLFEHNAPTAFALLIAINIIGATVLIAKVRRA